MTKNEEFSLYLDGLKTIENHAIIEGIQSAFIESTTEQSETLTESEALILELDGIKTIENHILVESIQRKLLESSDDDIFSERTEILVESIEEPQPIDTMVESVDIDSVTTSICNKMLSINESYEGSEIPTWIAERLKVVDSLLSDCSE